MLGTTLRRFTTDDYSAIADLHNGLYTEMPWSPEALRFEEESRPAKCRSARWVVERDSRIVGACEYVQWPFAFHPQKFEGDILVDKAYWGQGIGAALFEHLMVNLRPLDPISLAIWTREDMPCRVRFLQRRGFTDDMRMWSSALDLERFDLAPFSAYVESVQAQGIQIATFAELQGSPGFHKRLYDLLSEVRKDIPLPPGETYTHLSYDEFLTRLQRPTLMPEAYFIAVDGDRYVGLSNLERSPVAELGRTGLTGVRRAYRGRGIAYALKVRALAFARDHGYKRLVTENAAVNAPMLSINLRLGFRKLPAWVRYRKQF